MIFLRVEKGERSGASLSSYIFFWSNHFLVFLSFFFCYFLLPGGIFIIGGNSIRLLRVRHARKPRNTGRDPSRIQSVGPVRTSSPRRVIYARAAWKCRRIFESFDCITLRYSIGPSSSLAGFHCVMQQSIHVDALKLSGSLGRGTIIEVWRGNLACGSRDSS